MQDQIRRGLFLYRGRRRRVGRLANPDTRTRQVDGAEPDEQSQGGDQFKINEGFDAHASNLLQVGMPGNAHHQRGEDQGRDDGADQAQKDRAQYLKLFGESGEVMADLRAQEDSDHDPRGERAAGPGVSAESQQGDPARDGQKQRIDSCAGVMMDRPEHAGNPGQHQEGDQKFALVRGFCLHLSRSSSSIELCVFWSRYFTITGVYSASPHSAALPLLTARDPGTTTAPSGITRGESAVERYTCSRTMSYTGVARVRITPAPSTAPLRTCVPS